jgi:outer membrane protein OmpA-like peptidoglycan-associated protein
MISLKRYRKFMAVTIIALMLGVSAVPGLLAQDVSVPLSPSMAMEQLESKLLDAREKELNVLSPTWFAKAEDSLAEAKKIMDAKGEMGRLEKAISSGLTEINQAEVFGSMVRAQLPDAIEARRLARTAGATRFEKEYAAAEKRFLGLSRDVENEDINSAKKDQPKVVDAFHALEIKAIKETVLGDTRKILAQAEKEKARKLVPGLYAEAQEELAAVEKFIASYPYATEEMQQRGTVALFKANRLFQINRQVTRLKEMKPLDTALWIEDILFKSSESLGAPDMRDKAFNIQMGNILGSIDALVQDRDYLVQKTEAQQEEMDTMRSGHLQEIEFLKSKNREEAAVVAKLLNERQAEQARLEVERSAERERLQAQKQAAEARLAAERRFNEQYNEVQALFTEDEAECYKQGNRMVIRLRGMTFPVGQAVIMPDNYALLSKVQRAVRTFTEPKVTIEGHTDSTGSAELNDHLSQLRAESVKQYLLANSVLKENQVAAAGYGSSRPLAPNTTDEGRAANRRIDVVITPRGALQ